ncbi:MAG: ClpXP protease specificity-enhancing factor SspB [Rickettsiaceae bacterium]
MLIDYQLLIDEAMLSVVKKILINTKDNGLLSNQCFYISFRTDRPDVILSKKVKLRYPKEITIVLEHQFHNLMLFENKFCVCISFGGITEKVEVPFSALTGFIDPLASFNLQFERYNKVEQLTPPKKQGQIKTINPSKKQETPGQPLVNNKKEGKIIAIDAFLKKNIPNDK